MVPLENVTLVRCIYHAKMTNDVNDYKCYLHPFSGFELRYFLIKEANYRIEYYELSNFSFKLARGDWRGNRRLVLACRNHIVRANLS